MRCAIVSDLHANLQAWNTTLVDIRSLGVDHIVCLGDLVGYGPNPAEVLQSVHAEVDDFALGNHDAVLCGKMDGSLFNDRARAVIEWTRGQLAQPAINFLSDLPLSLAGEGFRCAHGDFSEPGAFRYVIDPADALPSWQAVPDPILFVGHTHQAGAFLLRPDGEVETLGARDFTLSPGERYLVNVGSVGQPRDGEARSCYVVFDSEAGTIAWRRVAFDIDAYRTAVRAAGLPEAASYFLTHDPRLGRPPLREILNFSPPRNSAQAVHDAVAVQELTTLRGRVRKWKALALAVLAAAAVAIAGGVGAWWWQSSRTLVLRGERFGAFPASRAGENENLLATPRVAPGINPALDGWAVRLGDKRKQHVLATEILDDSRTPPAPAPAIVLRSTSDRDDISLIAAPILVAPGMKFTLEGAFRKAPGTEGTVQATVACADDTTPHAERTPLVNQVPNLARKNGWMRIQKTFSVPAGGKVLYCEISGRFRGEIACQGLSLTRR